MKHTRIWLPLFLLILALSAMSIAASAAGRTVVYLADGGKGDGSTPETPVGSLTAAYDALDLSEDCTVVLVGKFTQKATFIRKASYTGSVTLTSVYDGVDYRQSGAVYEFVPCRFVLFGDTTFENMNFNALGTNLLVVAQHHKVTVGEGVTITGDRAKLTGDTVARSFCILGGYQSGQSNPPAAGDLDTDITVLSGSKIYIVAFSRSLKGPYTGTAHIKIGGTADVSTLHLTAAYPDGVKVGTTEVEITDNAKVGNIYGTTQNTTADGFKITWRSGTIGKYEPVSAATPGKILTVTGETVLATTDKAKQNANFATVAAQFDRVESLGGGTDEKVGTLTTVYLADGGTGDGKTPNAPVGSLEDAYAQLDLTKDCKIVLVGAFTQSASFAYGKDYEGSVTLTAVDGGTDYRTRGAVWNFNTARFVLSGKTTFENIDFKALDRGLLVVAQHHPVTLGEGVTVTGDKLSGSTIANSFAILGGYQKNQSNPPLASDADTNITVLSGSKLYIVAFSREILGEYTGTAHIKIGGNADVSVLHASAAYPDGVKVGKTEVELTDSARIGMLYGTTQVTEQDALTVTWRAGSIDKCEILCAATPKARIDYKNGKVLKASDTARAAASFDAVSAQFDQTVAVDEDAAVETKVEIPAINERYGAAVGLYNLHLVAGYDNTGTNFGLDDSMTRAQAVVQVIRYLGVEKTALSGGYTHPFKDVPAWADKYIGYAYANGITKGRSNTVYDPNGAVTETQFLTFMLRAIGYDDAAGDFKWDAPEDLAKKCGMTDTIRDGAVFLRGDAMKLCWQTLSSKNKSGKRVADALIAGGVFTAEELTAAGNAAKTAKKPAQKNTVENGYYVLPKTEYLEKTKSGFLAQLVGFMSGYEFARNSDGTARIAMPDSWFEMCNGPYAEHNSRNPHEDKLLKNESTGLWDIWNDDDYSIDILNQYILRDMYATYGTVASKLIKDDWVRYDVWDMGGGHRSFGAYGLFKGRDYLPQFVGTTEFGNLFNVNGEPYIANETLGLNTPGMPNLAVELATLFGGVTSDRDPTEWAKMFTAMISMAYFEDDVPTLIRRAAEVLPEGSYEREVVDMVFRLKEEYPTDWRRAVTKAEKECYRAHYDLENYVGETGINCSFILISLLYGDGDYYDTCRICSLAGHGGDSTTPVALSVVAVMNGMKNLPDAVDEKIWQDGKGEIVNLPIEGTNSAYHMYCAGLPERLKIADLVDLYRDNFEKLLVENGGKITDTAYYIPVTDPATPDTVLPVDGFESGNLDGYTTTGGVAGTETPFAGSYAARIAGNESRDGEIVKTLTGLTVGKTYRITAFVSTSAGTSAYLFAREAGKTGVRAAVCDNQKYIKRSLTFTATAATMEIGLTYPAGNASHKSAAMDELVVVRVEETPAATVSMTQSGSKVDFALQGGDGKEALLKLTFENNAGKIVSAKATVDGASYASVPFYPTGAALASDANTVYIPVIVGANTTVSLDFGSETVTVRDAAVIRVTERFAK